MCEWRVMGKGTNMMEGGEGEVKMWRKVERRMCTNRSEWI